MIEFREARIDSGDGQRLERAMAAEIAERYDGLDLSGPDMPKAGPDEMNPPNGIFIVGFEDGEGICCGGLKRLSATYVEIKRMYVMPQARGRGVARNLLGELERRARSMGFEVAKLDTGDRQPDAMHLYESAGYQRTGNYNANPVATWFGEKRLGTAVAFVPDDFIVPLGISGQGFALQPLGAQHNEADHRAWMSSIEHIHATPGFSTWRWPPAEGMSLQENLRDLEQHAEDFKQRVGFTYTVIDDDGVVVGCVYIYPSRAEPEVTEVRSWVTASRAELDPLLHQTVAGWLAADWPLTDIRYR